MKITFSYLQHLKREGKRFTCITAYSYPIAKILDETGIPFILVGDSLGMVELGYKDTLEVTLDDIIHHAKAVRRGVQEGLVVVDMPFMQTGIDLSTDLLHIQRVMQETGADGVKIEGASWTIQQTIRQATDLGVPVVGHIGMQPQQVRLEGKYSIKGNTHNEEISLIDKAADLEKAGVVALVLECVTPSVAQMITDHISIPTIGIAAGNVCDAEVQVFHDLIGLSKPAPRHAQTKANLDGMIRWAIGTWKHEVEDR